MVTAPEQIRLLSRKFKCSAIPCPILADILNTFMPAWTVRMPVERRFKFYSLKFETDCRAFLSVAKRLTDQTLRNPIEHLLSEFLATPHAGNHLASLPRPASNVL